MVYEKSIECLRVMRKAFFVKDVVDIDRYLGDLSGDTLVVHSDVISPETHYPKIGFSKYSVSYDNYHPDNLVVVGMQRIRTPDRRYNMVFPYMYNLNTFSVKVTIDDRPFMGEPWRLWYQYGFLYGKWLKTSYSNALESDWLHWFYRESETADIANLSGEVRDTYTDLPELDFSVSYYPPTDADVEFYTEVKEAAFEKYSTPKQLIQYMSRHLNRHFGLRFGYDSYLESGAVSLPDFGIYRFLGEENVRRMEIYNTVVRESQKI